jgi:hypothetical protein
MEEQKQYKIRPKSKQTTPTNIKELAKKNLCFNCRKSGHMAKNCPEPKESAKVELNSINTFTEVL